MKAGEFVRVSGRAERRIAGIEQSKNRSVYTLLAIGDSIAG